MKEYKSQRFHYDNRVIMGIMPKWKLVFYILLGGRGVGKTFSTLKYCIKRWVKYGEPFAWLRLKEPSVKKLLANDGIDFVPTILRKRFKLNEFKTKNNIIYCNGRPFCRIMALSTFYQDKGVDLYGKVKKRQLKTTDKFANKSLNNALKAYRTIVLDEMNAERSEKRTIDIVYALVNQLENLCRLDTDRKIFMLGNTLEEGSDILANAFGFIPDKPGIYLIPKKHALIHSIKDSDKYTQERANSIAGWLAPEESTFTNKIESDLELLERSKDYKSQPISYIIDFGNGQKFIVKNNVITNEKVPKTYNGFVVAMRPYIPGIPYYKEIATKQIELAQQRQFKFNMLITLKKFMSQIKILKESR